MRIRLFELLYIHKDYQRQGIAAILLQALEKGCEGSKYPGAVCKLEYNG